jgi:hypothetical protein
MEKPGEPEFEKLLALVGCTFLVGSVGVKSLHRSSFSITLYPPKFA